MTNRRIIPLTVGLGNTRRSFGDGTMAGRVRIATPYDSRKLIRPGMQRTPRSPQGETATLLAPFHEVSPTPSEIEFTAVDGRPIGGFSGLAASLPTREWTFGISGYYTVTPENLDASTIEGDGLVIELLVNGTTRDTKHYEWLHGLDDRVMYTQLVRAGDLGSVQVTSAGTHDLTNIAVHVELVDTPQGRLSDPPPAAPDVVGVVEREQNGPVTFTHTAPDGTSVGDIMVASWAINRIGPTSSFSGKTPAAGWTLLNQQLWGGLPESTAREVRTYWRRATAGDAAQTIDHQWTVAGEGSLPTSLLVVAYGAGSFPAAGPPFSTVEQIFGFSTTLTPLTLTAPSGSRSIVVAMAQRHATGGSGTTLTLAAPTSTAHSFVPENLARGRHVQGIADGGATVQAAYHTDYTVSYLLAAKVAD